MASGRGFTGFESGSTGDAQGGTIVANATIGRSGPRYLSVPMVSSFITVPAGTMTVSVLAMGGSAGFICRMFIRNTGIGGSTTTQGILAVGTNEVRINTSGHILVGDATRGYADAGPIPNDGAWHELVIINDQHNVTMPAAAIGSILGYTVSGSVYNFIGSGTQASSCIAVSIDGGGFIGHGRDDGSGSRTQTDIKFGNSSGAGGTGQFLIDDVAWAWNDAAIPVLPTHDHIYPVGITAIASQTGFTGSLSDVTAYPPTVAGSTPPYYSTALQSTSPTAVVTFQHASSWTLVIGDVEAIRAVPFVRRASGGTPTFDIKLGAGTLASVPSASIPQTNTTPEIAPNFYDYTGWTSSAFGSLTFGITQTAAGTFEIGSMILEVIASSYTPVTPSITSVAPPSGTTLGGTTVTLGGTFNPTTSFLFGEYGSALVSLSETTAVVTSPAHPAGPVDMVAVTPVPGSPALTSTLPDAYTFVAPPIVGEVILDVARRAPEVSIIGQLGNGQGSFNFSVNGADATPYVAGRAVDMQLGTGVSFAKGVVLQTTKTVEDSRENQRVDCRGNDNVWVLNGKRVSGTWSSVSASTIAVEILRKFGPDFSTLGIQSGLPAISLSFYLEVNIGQALDKICTLLPDGHWYLDTATNTVHLFNGVETGVTNPSDVDDSNQDLLISDSPISVKTDISQIRNRVYVRGAGSASSTGYQPPVGAPQGDPGGEDPWVSEGGGWGSLLETGGNIDTNRNTPGSTWYWSASYIFVWTTTNGRSLAIYVQRYPTPTPLGGSYVTGSNQLSLTVGYANLDSRITGLEIYREIQRQGPHALNAAAYGNSDLYTPNVDSGHGPFFLIHTATTADVVGSPAGTPYRYLDTASEDTLVGGTMMKYSQLIGLDHSANIFAMEEDTVSQANLKALLGYTDGVREYLIVDTSITTEAEAQARAIAELELWANPVVEVTYVTVDQRSTVGATVHFNLTEPAIVGDFKIQSVRQIHVHEDALRRAALQVTASSVRFTLNDLFAHVVLDTDPSGGVASLAGSSSPDPTPSGAAATASKLSPGRNINGVFFDGSVNINVPAAMDHIGEVPSGAINGANTVFTLSATYQPGKLLVYLNGLRQKSGGVDYSETSSTTFTFVNPPVAGDLLLVDFESA